MLYPDFVVTSRYTISTIWLGQVLPIHTCQADAVIIICSRGSLTLEFQNNQAIFRHGEIIDATVAAIHVINVRYGPLTGLYASLRL
ncbi:hypothetical protein UNDYM_6011 (plasmid) [Undibacterium sp. YM2]|nr:hypothetical protein UNDYM_6011 [Undibacterium sp. YM2]